MQIGMVNPSDWYWINSKSRLLFVACVAKDFYHACILSSFLSMYSPLSLRSLQSPTLFQTKLKDSTTRRFWAFLIWKQTFWSWRTRIGLWLVDLAKCKRNICSALLIKGGGLEGGGRRCWGFGETRIICSSCSAISEVGVTHLSTS